MSETAYVPLGAGVHLVGARGEVTVTGGERFKWWDGTEWEVVGLGGGWNYSPSGLGGCPGIVCRHLAGELRGGFATYTHEGLCLWCGDSVASGIIGSARGES